MIPARRRFFNQVGQGLLDTLFPAVHAMTGQRDTLVCVFLRGGMDALNAVVPHAEGHYYDRRPKLAVPEPGRNGMSAIDLDGFFGLHPQLAPLKPLYDNGDLAIVHACGAPFASRSHFSAQELVELGRQGRWGKYSGWLGRHLAITSSAIDSTTRAIAVGHSTPIALRGQVTATALNDTRDFGFASSDQEDLVDTLRAFYGGASLLDQQAEDTFDVLNSLAEHAPAQFGPDNGAQYPDDSFGKALRQAGQYIKSNLGPEVIYVDSGGWDHHGNLASRLPEKLASLAAGMSAFDTDMGERMQQTTVVVMSEFGRRAAENASAGTDHGHGGCMLVLGKGVNGGRVYADWPGLADHQLDQGDLAITTDYRTVLGELLVKRMGNDALEHVFPGVVIPGFLDIFQYA